MRLLKLLFVFVSVLLMSCAAHPTPAAPASTQSIKGTQPNQIKEQTGYPAPGETGAIETALPTQTADPNLGSVKGKLLQSGKPIKNANLYLAVAVKNSDGKEIAATMNRDTSPQCITDDLGQFVFINVPPGNYRLVLDMILEQYLLLNPKDNTLMTFDIVAGKQTDLGTMDYGDFPNQP
jgi:hypothetical protein